MSFNDNAYGYNGPLAHTAPIYKKLNILKVNDVFQYQIIRFVYDSLNKISPYQFHDWFIMNSNNHDHATRSNATLDAELVLVSTNNLFVPFARTSHYGLKSVKIKGPSLWNEVPYNIRKINSRNMFKRALKKHFILLY